MAGLTIPLKSEEATAKLGASLAPVLAASDVILLSGDLGAGKSTLARGLIKVLCGHTVAPSPTFTFVATYAAEDFSLWHFDLYRLERAEDVWELGLEDALNDGATLIEWPERMGRLAPADALVIRLEIDGGGRMAVINPNESWRKRLAAAGIV